MRPLALTLLALSAVGLGACDSDSGFARADSESFWDPSAPVQLDAQAFPDYRESFDWNFHIETEGQIGEASVSFRTFAVTANGEPQETSRIVMTPQADGTYHYRGVWPGYSRPNARVFAVVLDSTRSEGLRAVGPFDTLGDEPQTTRQPAKSYHVHGGTTIIDHVDTDDGLLPAPTTAFFPTGSGGGTTVHQVAYLVYVPRGRRVVDGEDALVRVWGPRGAEVVTESIGSGELPQTVLRLSRSRN